MSLSLIARRAPAIRSGPMAWSRSIHASKPAQASHGAYTTADAVPFSFKNKGAFGFKVISYFGFGLALPLVASGYQLWKK